MEAPSLTAAVLEYLDALAAAGAPKNTVLQYRSVLLRLCRRYPGRQYRGINTRAVTTFLYGREGILVGKAPGTGIVYRSALRGFFHYGQKFGWGKAPDVEEAPIPPRQPKTNALPTRLTPAQLRLLLENAEDPMLRCILAVAMNTALRISDILDLQAKNASFVTGELLVWNQKTGYYDELPMTLDLEEELRKYLSWWTAETGATLKDSEAFLFPGWRWRDRERFRDTENRVAYSWARMHLVNLFAECGIEVNRKEAWHTIRRSVARIYFDSLRNDLAHNHALRQTAALLGHASVTTTERYLGMKAEIEARNESLRGKRLIPDLGPVIPLRRRHG